MGIKRIQIEQTETEFILTLPYESRHRAKSIEGYHWDPDRRSWIYPRTRRVFDALINEFGGDLVEMKISPPNLPRSRFITA